MTKLRIGLLITAGAAVLLLGAAEFVLPASGELTAEQAGRFAAVEEAVQARLAAGAAGLAAKQAELEQASDAGSLSVRMTPARLRRLSQLDVSDILAGEKDATAVVRHFEPGDLVGGESERLARQLAPKLEGWRALGFFGL